MIDFVTAFVYNLKVYGNSVRKISEDLNISAKEIAAFGYDLNHSEMLKYCGIVAAMGSAAEGSSRNADFSYVIKAVL